MRGNMAPQRLICQGSQATDVGALHQLKQKYSVLGIFGIK